MDQRARAGAEEQSDLPQADEPFVAAVEYLVGLGRARRLARMAADGARGEASQEAEVGSESGSTVMPR